MKPLSRTPGSVEESLPRLPFLLNPLFSSQALSPRPAGHRESSLRQRGVCPKPSRTFPPRAGSPRAGGVVAAWCIPVSSRSPRLRRRRDSSCRWISSPRHGQRGHSGRLKVMRHLECRFRLALGKVCRRRRTLFSRPRATLVLHDLGRFVVSALVAAVSPTPALIVAHYPLLGQRRGAKVVVVGAPTELLRSGSAEFCRRAGGGVSDRCCRPRTGSSSSRASGRRPGATRPMLSL